MTEYSMNDVKKFASHLRTLGAYVQDPDPTIVGLSKNKAIGSQDAAALYPSIVVLLNIGYDTFRGRIYDMRIVGNTLKYLDTQKELMIDDPEIFHQSIANFRTSLVDIAKAFVKNGGVKEATGKFIEFTQDYYGDLFGKLLVSELSMVQIFRPETNEAYYLSKSVLYPLLEALTWMHYLNKGYSEIATDWVFANEKFDNKYEDSSFFALCDINSTKSYFKFFNIDEFKDQILKSFLITPYGTYFEKHDVKESFEDSLIINGLANRKAVKNEFLVLGVVIKSWDKLSDEQKSWMLIKEKKLTHEQAYEIIEIVGDPTDENVRKWQLSVLEGNIFDNDIELDKLFNKLKLVIDQKTSVSNGIKTTLNSGYGLYGLLTWGYGNNLIANSITTGGKIYGIRLFQQVAATRLAINKKDIEEGKYEKPNR